MDHQHHLSELALSHLLPNGEVRLLELLWAFRQLLAGGSSLHPFLARDWLDYLSSFDLGLCLILMRGNRLGFEPLVESGSFW
jgi:hypothetical protein